MENLLEIRSPREPSLADKQTVRELFYAMPLIERGKPIQAELTWILLGRQNPDGHEKLLPDYCYNIFDVAQKTVFKAFPLFSDTLCVMDKAGAESAKTIEAAKKAVRLDWRNLGKATGVALRCIRFAQIEAKDYIDDDGFDELPPDKARDFYMIVFGRRWVEENESKIRAESPGKLVSDMFNQYLASWMAIIKEKKPYFESLSEQWSPEAMIQFQEGIAEGMGNFMDGQRNFVGESGRAGIYAFLLLAWPEISAMQESHPRKTITHLHEWMLPFMRVGVCTYLEVDELRAVCAPPPKGIGLALRPLFSK